jgi:Ca2+-binding EF-hand superfamily protein
MIEEVDTDGNGEIDFEEFVVMMSVFLENHDSLME